MDPREAWHAYLAAAGLLAAQEVHLPGSSGHRRQAFGCSIRLPEQCIPGIGWITCAEHFAKPPIGVGTVVVGALAVFIVDPRIDDDACRTQSGTAVWKEYPMEVSLAMDEARDVRRWLGRVLTST